LAYGGHRCSRRNVRCITARGDALGDELTAENVAPVPGAPDERQLLVYAYQEATT